MESVALWRRGEFHLTRISVSFSLAFVRDTATNSATSIGQEMPRPKAYRPKELNSCLRTSINYGVRGFKTILTLLALALWLPCTARCELEKARVLPTPSCCEEHSQSEKMPPNCGICESVASGYFSSESKITVPTAFIVSLPFAALSEVPVERDQVSFAPEEQPPSILNIFQFTSRTALPVRAPSAS